MNCHIFNIIQNQKIRLISCCNCTKSSESIAFRRIDRGHANSIDRIHAELYCLTYIMIDMSFFFNIFDMFIISTEAEAFSVHLMPDNAGYNCLEVSCRTAFTDMYRHSTAPLLHCIVKIRTLMICRDSSHHISLQIRFSQKRCMPVSHSFSEQIQFAVHGFISIHYRYIVHHFSQAQYSSVTKIRYHILCSNGTSIVVNCSCRYTRRHHHKYICLYIFCLIQDIINTL